MRLEAVVSGPPAGGGPPVLALHGFPQTHVMWRAVAADLATDHTVVCADLPGYGASDVPPPGGASKRAMAAAMVALMRTLGHERFAVVGHDRGGRVAYRPALDHPEAVTALSDTAAALRELLRGAAA